MPRTKPKDLGTRWESDVLAYVKRALDDERPERRVLHGSKDMGDIAHVYAHGFEGIIECKRSKALGAATMAEFQRQTLDERENADADFALLVVKNFNHGTGEGFCWVTIRDLTRICLGIESNGELADLYDDVWVCIPLSTACALMRGLS